MFNLFFDNYDTNRNRKFIISCAFAFVRIQKNIICEYK
jgi:hypothetical protein